MKLVETRVRGAKPQEKQYKITDGAGLYLLVKPNGSKYWRLDYRFGGKRKTLALGVYPIITLQRARVLRDGARRLVAEGVDPNIEKRETKRKRAAQDLHSFEKVTIRWFESQSVHWTPKHKDRVLKSFKARVFPDIGHLGLEIITPQDILIVLRKMEAEGLSESVRRVKQNIERVFTFAVIEGIIHYNPAQNLEKALRPPAPIKHQNYLKEEALPEFLEKLEDYDGGEITKLAIEFTMLTLARSAEVRFASWLEIDWEKKEWRIPAQRMKMNEAHVVPLSEQALDVLRRAKKLNRLGGYIFEGSNARKPISENTMIYAFYRMGYKGRASVHGLRSTGSTILNENGFRADIIERLLAHGEKNKIRAAYNHAQYLPERREALQWYANKLDSLKDTNNVGLANFSQGF